MPNSFITIGDSKYFPSVALSAIQAKKFHPECLFGIYDWGFTQGELKFLVSLQNVRIVDWKNKFTPHPFADNYIKSIYRSTRAGENLELKAKLFLRSLVDLMTVGLRGKEWIYAQKPYCYAHWAVQPEIEKFIFLDGDALLMSSVSELFSADFDLGVTLRRPHEVDFTPGRCQVLNSGVVIFASTPAKNILFIDGWIREMSETSSECFLDQTSLTRLVLGYDNLEQARYGEQVEISIEGIELIAKILDCETYNFNWIEEGVDPSINKIVHFKGGRHSGERFYELAKALDLKTEVDHILQWHQS